jgi:hypothetical protein
MNVGWGRLLLVAALGSGFHVEETNALAREVGRVTLRVAVVMPDGSPAAGAIVESWGGLVDPDVVATADETGRTEMRGVFGSTVKIQARSPGGAHQAVRIVAASAVRALETGPIELTLLPAACHEVTVLSCGQPVEGAHLAASGPGFRVRGVTDKDGKCRIHMPAGQTLRELFAWHPELGVTRKRDWESGIPEPATSLTLPEPVPYTIRVVDPDGQPVSDQKIGTALTRYLDAARKQTNEDGQVVLPWVPRETPRFVGVDLVSSSWKIDDVDSEPEERITTVHLRRRTPVEGRVVMPEGAPSEGLLITGFGFGPGNRGDIPCARVRKDGTFTINVASAHGYILGVADREWASNLWSGVILGSDSDEPRLVELEAYPATSLKVKVTRGENRQPIRDAWVEVSRRGSVGFLDRSGNPRQGRGSVREWLRTDAHGIARTGVGRGEVEVRLSSGAWEEVTQVAAKPDEPVEVEFHRNWLGKRRVTARMTLDGAAYQPSPDLDAFAWTERSPEIDVIHKPELRESGEMELSFDQEAAAILVIDRGKRRSGFVRLGLDDLSAELVMQPTATYRGTLLDEKGGPIADRRVRLLTASSFLEILEPQPTDAEGQFVFTGVPVEIPLTVGIVDEPYAFEKRLFEPGEVRTDDRLKVRLSDAPAPRAPATRPLAERVVRACENVRVTGMRALVVLQGDESEDVSNLAGRLLNYHEVEPAIRYLSVRATPAQWRPHAAYLKQRNWPSPEEGEIVMIVLSGSNETIATERIRSEDVGAGVTIGSEFLTEHMPASHDALALVAEANEKAKTSGRRVWIIEGGPRCGPCFRLARWMEPHRATLEKDYVLVKLMGGIDEHVEEVIQRLTDTPHGIPWYAITEPDGSVLITSDSPLGNIGFPSSLEGRRHFRKMLAETANRLMAEEIDGLMESLSADE